MTMRFDGAKESDADRLHQVEVQLLHLQRHVEQLDGVVLELGTRLDRQARKIVQLEGQLRDAREKPRGEVIDPVDEKPPHY